MARLLREALQRNAATAFDLAVLHPLEMDAFPFESLLTLLQHESFLSHAWFPLTDFDPEHVLMSLRRLLAAGLVQCHEDGALSSPSVASPQVDLMRFYWYSLSSLGSEVIRAGVPWYYDVLEWSFYDSGESLSAAVERLRANPLNWLCADLDVRPTSLRSLRGWVTHFAAFQEIGGGAIVAHFIDRNDLGVPRLCHGHFRPSDDSRQIMRADGLETKENPSTEGLSNLDLLVLDALQDDLESIPSVLSVLSHPELSEAESEVKRFLSEPQVAGAFHELAKLGLISAYSEGMDRGRLGPARNSQDTKVAGLWFGLTAVGEEVAMRTQRQQSKSV